MRSTRLIAKATNTRSEYAKFIAFPPQQWLHEPASVLRYTYTACLAHFPFERARTVNG